MEKLSPFQISASFARHIQEERVHVRPAQPIDNGQHIAGDWCVDRFHTVSGQPGDLKPASSGVIVAGAGIRRALDNVPGLSPPHLFMQEAVQIAGGHVTVLIRTHEHCGEAMVSHGAVTPQLQAELVKTVIEVWQSGLDLLHRSAPADAKRVKLQHVHSTRGSAPTIRDAENGNSGRIEIANLDYLTTIMQVYPLNSGILEILIPEHQNLVRSLTSKR